MGKVEKSILAACARGDIAALELLLKENNLHPDQPKTIYELNKELSADEQLPHISYMLNAAVKGEHVETVTFLYANLPSASFFGAPMQSAINTCNVDMLRTVCKLDPKVANSEMGDDSYINALGYASSRKNAAELITVLLEAGADPNEQPPGNFPDCRNVTAAVIGGLPVSTFEQFFDAGYQGIDPFAVERAVDRGRLDVLEVLITRGKDLPYAEFPPEKDLIERAKQNKDREMVEAIRRLYKQHSLRKKKRELIASALKRISAKS
jgi:hypothetical protein